MQVTERLSGSHFAQDEIADLDAGDCVTVMQRLDKPGQWLVIDDRSERIGFLTAASGVAKALNTGRRLVHAWVASVSHVDGAHHRRTVKVSFQLADSS